MNYSHFIITQFNLRNFPLADNNEHDQWLQWTRNRIDLFREYCLPSVVNQSDSSFTWLLYFDSSTPGEFDGFLNGLKSFPFINICYCNGIEGFKTEYFSEIRKRIPPSTDWIITTRVDNDDCLHWQAIKTIRDNFIEKHKFLISLASGYILNLNDRTMSHYYYPMSPFISLIENVNQQPGGVFEKGHTKWDCLRLFVLKEIWLDLFKKSDRKSRFILKRPLWIQIFHGDNVSNSFYRGLPVLKSRDLRDFSIRFPSAGQPVKSIFKYPDYVRWKRYLKSYIVKILLKK